MSAGSARGDEPAAFGVDVGGTKLHGVAVAADGRVIVETRAATPPVGRQPARPGIAIADAVVGIVEELQAALVGGGARPPIGIGVPGMLDRHGVLVFSPNLPSAVGADFAGLLADRVSGAPPVLENDANCAALAEHALGAARGFDDVVVVTLGTGIGGGLVVGGRPLLGAQGFAGEIGHMVVDPSGPLCPCGRRGCWERFASGAGLANLAREAAIGGRLPEVVSLAGGDPEAVRGEHVTGAALAGDVDALGVLRELAWWVAFGLANLAAVLDPQRFVIGGGLAVGAGECLLGPARVAFDQLVEGGSLRAPVDIVMAELGERSGAVGAALAARRQAVKDR
ncbi:MAG TPA: ROK family protein [Acidimicrobiales bacterium]|nr:ROK family protein [Acidimicrobiales bacterium]